MSLHVHCDMSARVGDVVQFYDFNSCPMRDCCNYSSKAVSTRVLGFLIEELVENKWKIIIGDNTTRIVERDDFKIVSAT